MTGVAPARALRTAALAVVALVAFAANSLLCRLALGGGQIDAASFTAVRLLAGALALSLIVAATRRSRRQGRGSWSAAVMLFLYAASFSFAYLSLTAGTGALILFGAVQATMILAGLAKGERPRRVEWLGLLVALGGLVYLVVPGLTAPPPLGSALMAVAGIAWGFYSLRGRGAGDPVVVTRDNFLRAVPWALGLSLLAVARLELSWPGVFWAAVSGAITSGAGYAVWYAALAGLTSTRAAIVQLAVPALAAAGGVIVLDERLSWRLVLSAALILGGVGLSLTGRQNR
jgi:drug/metabolite transporter (DMT)-like permease